MAGQAKKKRKLDSTNEEFKLPKEIKINDYESGMKTIGIIGGLAYPSTIEYYRWINEEIHDYLSNSHTSKIAIMSVDCQQQFFCGKVSDYAPVLINAAKKLESFCDVIIIACNTAHLNYKQVASAIPKCPILHIADACALPIKDKGIKTIGLLGTKFTMENENILINRFRAHGLEVIVPEEEKIKEEITRIITTELNGGKTLQESKKPFLDAISAFRKKGASATVLGCTEIGLLIKQSDMRTISDNDDDMLLFDTAWCHAHAAAQIQLFLKSVDDYLP